MVMKRVNEQCGVHAWFSGFFCQSGRLRCLQCMGCMGCGSRSFVFVGQSGPSDHLREFRLPEKSSIVLGGFANCDVMADPLVSPANSAGEAMSNRMRGRSGNL